MSGFARASIMRLCISTRSDGWTGHLSVGLAPPLLHSIWLSEKKIMLIWFSAKLLQSSSTHQNPAKPLSDAFLGMALRRDDVSSVRFLDRPANNQKKVKQLRKHAKNGNKLIQSPIDRCSVADLIVWEHTAYSNCCEIDSSFDELNCFLIWEKIVDLSEHEWNHRVRLRCELLESMFLPFAP